MKKLLVLAGLGIALSLAPQATNANVPPPRSLRVYDLEYENGAIAHFHCPNGWRLAYLSGGKAIFKRKDRVVARFPGVVGVSY